VASPEGMMEREPRLSQRASAPGLHGPAPAASVRLFVVHAPDDAWFVEGFLLEALRLPEGEVLVSSKLEPGAVIVNEIERGALSPVTIVVVSPARSRRGSPVPACRCRRLPHSTRVATASEDHTARVVGRAQRNARGPARPRGWPVRWRLPRTAREWQRRAGRSAPQRFQQLVAHLLHRALQP